MLRILLTLTELKQSMYSYIDSVIKSNLDYCELYIKPSKTDLYIKVKQGKKNVYKKVNYFYNIDDYDDKVMVSIKDNKHDIEDVQIEFEFELMPN